MLKKTILAGLVVAAIAGSWALLGSHGGGSAHAQAAQGGPPEVTVAPVMVRPVSDSADFTGQLQAVDTVDVRPRVSGYVNSVLFKEGTEVHKGDVLFVIDPRPFQAEVDRLSANVALLNGNQTFSGNDTFSNLIQASGGINAAATA